MFKRFQVCCISVLLLATNFWHVNASQFDSRQSVSQVKAENRNNRGNGKYVNIIATQDASNLHGQAEATSFTFTDITDISHSLTSDECLQSLCVDPSTGLQPSEVMSRLSAVGPNSMSIRPEDPLWRLVAEQFQDRLVQVLLGVAIFSAGLAWLEKDPHALAEPLVIAAILFANAAVGVYHAKSAEGSMDALKKLQPQTACVLRAGAWSGTAFTASLVPGDIISLRVGDLVPADARILALQTRAFSVDESSLTGESVSVPKTADSVPLSAELSARQCMVYSGTLVTAGSAVAVVTGTGARTEIGKIGIGVEAASAAAHSAKTPLAEKLDRFAEQLSQVVLGICLVVWLAQAPRFTEAGDGSWAVGALHHAKTAVALGVAAIPEGLPAVVGLCLSLGTKRMAARNVVVRRLSSVETLGCTSVICTDKTGTLTTNRMVVRAVLTFRGMVKAPPVSSRALVIVESSYGTGNGIARDDEEYVQNTVSLSDRITCVERGVSGDSYDPDGGTLTLSTDSGKGSWADLLAVCALCNQAQLEEAPSIHGHGHEMLRSVRLIGEPTEGALKVLVEKAGRIVNGKGTGDDGLSTHCDRLVTQYQRLALFEFSRERKRMSVLCRINGRNRLLVKGAAEVVASRCNRIELEDGRVVPITHDMREQLTSALRDMSVRPLRCVALAYAEGSALGRLQACRNVEETAAVLGSAGEPEPGDRENDMVLVGVCGIRDPPRPGVGSSMAKARAAGVRVMMITGDSRDTAVAIAKETGILLGSDGEGVGLSRSAFGTKDFLALPRATQLDLLRTGNKVFCRAEPRDKQEIISMLAELGEVSAMTGDGVNDAPALRQADIGVAMGIAGTEVAKQAADMVLTDDDFSSILSAVEEGRHIYANMQAFVSFLLSCNFGEILSVCFSSVLGLPSPLSPLHLLWVNLVTDGPPATALGFNPPDPQAMYRRPRPRSEPLLTPWLLTRYAITGAYVGMATLGAMLWYGHTRSLGLSGLRSLAGPALAHAQTLCLTVLVLVEMLKALAAVSLSQSLLTVAPWTNKYLIPCTVLPLVLHALLLQSPLAAPFGLHALTMKEWKVAAALSFPVLLLEEALKLVGRRLETAATAVQSTATSQQ